VNYAPLVATKLRELRLRFLEGTSCCFLWLRRALSLFLELRTACPLLRGVLSLFLELRRLLAFSSSLGRNFVVSLSWSRLLSPLLNRTSPPVDLGASQVFLIAP
jgi:hypothetical protein